MDGCYQQQADLSLALRTAYVKRHGRGYVLCYLVLQEDPADLRTVAVGDDDFPAHSAISAMTSAAARAKARIASAVSVIVRSRRRVSA